MSAFPWDDAMRLGFGVLKLSSRDFWGLTPRELAAAFEALSGPRRAPPDREQLKALMERFPDGR
jgi:uncharacterized phage protein (TIGR02216 family)